MSGGVKFGVALCLVVTMIVGAMPIGVVAESQANEGEVLGWDAVLGNSKIREDQEIILIHKPVDIISGYDRGTLVEIENGSFVWSNEPNRAMLDLSGLDLQIIEEYPAFTCALATLELVEQISNRGYHVEVIERATTIGRGAFSYDFRKESRDIPSNLILEWQGIENTYLFLLKLMAPPRPPWIAELEDLGVEVLDSAGFWTYLVKMPVASLSEIYNKYYVAWVEPYHYAYRISQEFADYFSDDDIESDQPTRIWVGVLGDEGCKIDEGFDVGHILGAYHVDPYCVVDLEVDTNKLDRVLQLDNTIWMELNRGEDVFFNDHATAIVQSGDIVFRYVHWIGIEGDNQIVTMADSGLLTSHPAFLDTGKVVDYYVPGDAPGDSIDNNGHGTHVAGTIAGDEAPYDDYSNYDGHAFEGGIIVQDIFNGVIWSGPSDYYAMMFGPAENAGSMIHTNSWGSYGNFYEFARTRSTDEFMFDHDDFLALWAAGNGGHRPTWFSIQGNAKNAVTVGASRNYPFDINAMADFSSRGPAGDGRLKPTLVAPGENVCSAYAVKSLPTQCHMPDTNYHVAGGTSMATPAVAGSAALIREYFQKGWYPTGESIPGNGFEPSAALVKAMLIASAQEISGHGTHTIQYNGMDFPNPDQGWGRVNLDTSMYFKENNDHSRLLVIDERNGFEQSGEWLEYSFQVGTPYVPIKVVLVWTDAPGDPLCDGTNPCIKNDLSMEVIDPEGTVYKGNVFHTPNPGVVLAESITGGDYDHLNVEEVVLDYTPVVGQWRVHVKAEAIDVSTQPFALVVTGGLTNELILNQLPGTHTTPSIASDSQGLTHVAWVQTLGTLDREVWYARYDESGYQETQVHLTDAMEDAYAPVIAVGPDDTIYVAFAYECMIGVSYVHYCIGGKKSITSGDTWVDVNIPGLVYFSFNFGPPREMVDMANPIDIYVDMSGHIHLAYTRYYNDIGQVTEKVFYIQSEDGGSTWPVFAILYEEPPYTDPGYPHYNKLRYPKVAKGRYDGGSGDDFVHAIFSWDQVIDPIGSPTGISRVYYVRSTDDGVNWAIPRNLGINTFHIARYNDLATEEDGPLVLAVWNEIGWPDPSGFGIWGERSDNDGDTWTSIIPAIGENNQAYPSIQIDNSGFVHLIYTDDTEGQPWGWTEVYFKSSLDGGVNWHAPTRVSDFIYYSSGPAIALNRHDTFEIAWSDDREGIYQVFHATLPTMSRVTYQSEHSHNPSIAVDSTGTSHTAWVENRDGDSDVYYARFDEEGRRTHVDISLTDEFDDASGDEQLGPVIVVAPDDTIYVVFAYEEEFDSQVLTYYLGGKKSITGGDTWIPFDVVPGNTVYHSIGVSEYREIVDKADPIDMYVDSSGHIHLIWTEVDDLLGLSTLERLFYAQSENGGDAWSKVELTSENYAEPGYRHYNRLRYPKVAKGQTAGGYEFVHAIFSWEDTDLDPIGGPWTGWSEIRYFGSPYDGALGTWNSPYKWLGDTSAIGRYNDLAADESGAGVFAVWHNYAGLGGANFDIYYARSYDNGDFWLDKAWFITSTGDQRWPAVAFDGSGHLHVSYSDTNTGSIESTDEIRHQAYMDASTPTAMWTDSRQLTLPWSGLAPSSKYRGAIAVGPGGRLHIAWEDAWGSSASWYEIYILTVF